MEFAQTNEFVALYEKGYHVDYAGYSPNAVVTVTLPRPTMVVV